MQFSIDMEFCEIWKLNEIERRGPRITYLVLEKVLQFLDNTSRWNGRDEA